VKCRLYGLQFIPPNLAFLTKPLAKGIAVDVGVGEYPDFTDYLIKNFRIETYIIDPTLKHMEKLQTYENTHPLAHYIPEALGSKNETVTFYESIRNESGSLRNDHVNVKNDPIRSYEVQVVTLEDLRAQCNNRPIAIMKIDIEGVEYDLLNSLTRESLVGISQLLVEFHHGTIASYSLSDTKNAIKKLESFGMKSIQFNGRDCLFYWSN
jgi:FkbM family methyltransferase